MSTGDFRYDLSDRPCAIISYPEPWDASTVAVVIALRCRRDIQNAVVVTGNPSMANSALNGSTSMKGNTTIMEYNSGNELNILSNTLIVFDSIQDLASLSKIDTGISENNVGYSILADMIKRGNTVIILQTYGVTAEQINPLKKIIPGAFILWAAFLQNSYHLQFSLHECVMTGEQEIAYSNVRKRELELLPGDISFEYSQKICNLLLPNSIQSLMGTSSEPNVELMLESFQKEGTCPLAPARMSKPASGVTVTPAVSTSTGAAGLLEFQGNQAALVVPVTVSTSVSSPASSSGPQSAPVSTSPPPVFDVDKFLVNGPKIRQLLIQLQLFHDHRHVIYTRYEFHHGARMLAPIIQSLGFNTLIITKDMPTSIKIETMKQFNYNRCEPRVLVLNGHIARLEGLQNVSHLHFIDSGYELYHILMQEIYKFRLYTCFSTSLCVHTYVCQRRGTKISADKALNDDFVIRQNMKLEYWDKIKVNSTPLYMSNDGYLALSKVSKKKTQVKTSQTS